MPNRSIMRALMVALGILAMTGMSVSAQGLGDMLKEKGKSAIPSGSKNPSAPSAIPSAAPSIPNVGSGLGTGALDSLKGQLSIKDGLIGGLQKTLTDKESQIKALQEELAASTGISANADVISSKLTAAQDTLKAKDATERALKAKIEELNQQNATLSKQLGSQKSAAASNKAEVADLKNAAVKATAERDIALLQSDTLKTHRLILGVLLILALLGLGILAMRRPKAV
jgi:hypothetical protein